MKGKYFLMFPKKKILTLRVTMIIIVGTSSYLGPALCPPYLSCPCGKLVLPSCMQLEWVLALQVPR